jgi:hypothetical protein
LSNDSLLLLLPLLQQVMCLSLAAGRAHTSGLCTDVQQAAAVAASMLPAYAAAAVSAAAVHRASQAAAAGDLALAGRHPLIPAGRLMAYQQANIAATDQARHLQQKCNAGISKFQCIKRMQHSQWQMAQLQSCCNTPRN